MTLSTNPTRAIEDINALIDLDLPVIMLGQPGVGKSDIAHTVAEMRGWPIIDFRATLIDPVELHGYPVPDREEGRARWLPMGLLPFESRDGPEGILLVDEITNARQDVKDALYGLILNRYIGEYHMPPGWRIIAAGNRIEDRANASRMPTALSNRFVHMTIEPTVDDWINWAMDKNVPAELVAFMRFRPQLLSDFDPARQINATPRSWAMVARIVAKGLPQETEQRLIMGAVGEGPGAELIAFLSVWRDLPNPDTVLMSPDTAPVPENSAGLYAISGALANRVRETSMDQFVTYMNRLPPEFGVMAMHDATSRDNGLAATKSYIEWAQANQDFYL